MFRIAYHNVIVDVCKHSISVAQRFCCAFLLAFHPVIITVLFVTASFLFIF